MKWNLLTILSVFPLPFHALLLLRAILPRAVLAVVLIGLGSFSFFESVYLAAEAAEFRSVRIIRWLRVFRAIALLLFGSAAALAIV
jgi:hypothetical protein